MNPKTTAIVWIDVDNEFLHEEGKLYGAVRDVLDTHGVIDNMNRLNRSARARGAQVIFIPIQFSADYSEMGEDPQGILRVVKDAGALQRDTWGTEVAECLEVTDEDLVLRDKTTTCAFATTNLEEELRRLGITDVILGGLLTNVCVESTVRSAYDRGFRVHSLTDCSATLSLEAHEASVQHAWPMFSRPTTHDQIVGELEA